LEVPPRVHFPLGVLLDYWEWLINSLELGKGVFGGIQKVFFRPDIDIDIELKFLMMRL